MSPQFRWLDKEFGADVARLRLAYFLKAAFAFVLIILAIAFGSLLKSGKDQDAAAVLEWIISFGFTLYILTFWLDLRQSKGVGKGQLNRDRLMAERAPRARGNVVV